MIKKKKLIQLFAEELHKAHCKRSLFDHQSYESLSYAGKLHYFCQAEMVLDVIEGVKGTLGE